ncbi:MAG: acyl-CoA thioesterase [Bacteroidales bacterium]|jgi:acyl-CoA thioester hydrolase|nr:acyl-CoA thioesterase [Bacteroidales bacterium]
MKETLTASAEVEVHFYDIDAVRIMWHGNYVKYLENGREAFGKKFGLEYMDIYRNGYIVPVADLHVRYLKPAALGDRLTVETRYVPCNSAKLMFDYTIYQQNDRSVVAEASTIQLFMTEDGIFEVSVPGFYRQWKKKWNIMENET